MGKGEDVRWAINWQHRHSFSDTAQHRPRYGPSNIAATAQT